LNKLDMVEDPERAKARLCELLDWKGPVFGISAMTGEGTQELIWALQDWLDAEKQRENIEQDKLEGIHVEDDPRFDPARLTPQESASDTPSKDCSRAGPTARPVSPTDLLSQMLDLKNTPPATVDARRLV